MSSQQKRGFRLPWAADRTSDEAGGAATLEADSEQPTTPAQIEDGVGGDLGEGPFHFADAATPVASTDASPEASDVPETAAEAAMLNTESATTGSATTEPVEAMATTDAASPTSSEDGEAQATPEQPAFQAVAPDTTADETPPASAAPEAPDSPSSQVEPDLRATRTNPLVAGLVKAMREAALASRSETTTRLQAEATARVEEIRTGATEEGAGLRKRVDEVIAAIRDWSKGEMARIRQETEAKIEARRSAAVAETNRHTAHVEKLVEQVQGRVEAFEADMDQFFERLLAENDPARLASLAEQAPEPPNLSVELPDPATGPESTAWDDVAWGGDDSTDAGAPSLEATAAAEAEAAATEGLDMPGDEVWPTSVLAAARRTLHHEADATFEAAGVANTRLFVNGLASVAGISAFKGALSQLSGVRSVSVSSGEPGVFIFTVVHSPEADLQDGIAGLTSFSARVTEASDDNLTVVAQEPAA
jgi:hypothetical protein